jgi:hypothetical protein
VRTQRPEMSTRIFWRYINNFHIAVGIMLALIVAAGARLAVAESKPDKKTDLGPNVLIFDPKMPQAAIQQQIDKIYAIERRNEFGPERYALLFLPGEYHVDVPVGFYTEVLGLGSSPDEVHISGNVHADASHDNNNATTTFWRAAEGFSVTPTGGTMQWAVSQAVSFRRMHVRGNLVLHQHRGQRRMDVRLSCRWERRFRKSTAMDFAEQRMEKLVRFELEHGFCWGSPSPEGELANAALYENREDASRAGETVPAR